jgi:hypothetical protein
MIGTGIRLNSKAGHESRTRFGFGMLTVVELVKTEWNAEKLNFVSLLVPILPYAVYSLTHCVMVL